MWSNKFILSAMMHFRFRIFSLGFLLEIQCFQCSTKLSTIFRSVPGSLPGCPSLAPGQVLLGVHRNCGSSSIARAERRSSSGAAISRRAAMSRIVRSDGAGPEHADLSLYVLPDRPGIQRARPGMRGPASSTRGPASASSASGPASSVRGPAHDPARAALHEAREAWHPASEAQRPARPGMKRARTGIQRTQRSPGMQRALMYVCE